MEVARSACRNALKESGHTPDYGDLETGDTFIQIKKTIMWLTAGIL